MDSIGSFAESLILQDLDQISEGKQSSFGSIGVSPEEGMPDISNINLDKNQVKSLLIGERVIPDKLEEPILESVQEQNYNEDPQPRKEDPIAILIEQLSYLVEKAESLVNRLDEMTVVGAIGTKQKFNLMQDEPCEVPPPPKVMNKVRNLRKYSRRKNNV